MAYRKKGGQRLMEIAKAGGKRKRAVKKKLKEQVKRNVAAGSKPRIASKTRKQAAANVAAGSKVRGPSASTRAQARKNIAKASKRTSADPPSLPKKIKGKESIPTQVYNYIRNHPVETAAEISAIHPAGRALKWA